MNIIFLDVDGVLNSEESVIRFHDEKVSRGEEPYACDEIFPEEYLNNLKELIELTDSKIVVSSTWRMWFPDGCHWKKLMSNLNEYVLDRYVIGITPRLQTKRGEEIRAWLKKHPETTNFVILDDDSDMCEFTETNLAQTSWKTGFTRDVLAKALKILGK